jgi:hypothetical protein
MWFHWLKGYVRAIQLLLVSFDQGGRRHEIVEAHWVFSWLAAKELGVFRCSPCPLSWGNKFTCHEGRISRKMGSERTVYCVRMNVALTAKRPKANPMASVITSGRSGL